MSNDVTVTMIGNLGSDFELRYTQGGKAVATASMVVNKRVKDASGNWAEGEPSWYRLNVWDTLAENTASSLYKGCRVIVTGRVEVRKWETDEKSGTSVEITADGIGPDLRWATCSVDKTERTGGTSSAPASKPKPAYVEDEEPF